MRRALGLLLGAALVLAPASAAGATAPAGPRLAYVELGIKPERLALQSVDGGGGQPLRLAGGPATALPLPNALETVSWASDGGQIAFAGTGGRLEEQGDLGKGGRVYVAAADGSDVKPVPGTGGGHLPLFAPGGGTLAFARVMNRYRRIPGGKKLSYHSISIWIDDLTTGVARQITPWKRGLTIEPTSFSPDSSKLATVRQRGRHSRPEIVLMNADGGDPVVLARNATDAVFSPDGSSLAYLRLETKSAVHSSHGGPATASLYTTSDLFTMRPDGSDSRRLTNTPDKLEIWPSWDPSGDRLAITQLRRGGFDAEIGLGDTVSELNPDGSCLTPVISAGRRSAVYGATWQPGTGRAAGPIAC